jgi:hypothetical protein
MSARTMIVLAWWQQYICSFFSLACLVICLLAYSIDGLFHWLYSLFVWFSIILFIYLLLDHRFIYFLPYLIDYLILFLNLFVCLFVRFFDWLLIIPFFACLLIYLITCSFIRFLFVCLLLAYLIVCLLVHLFVLFLSFAWT